MPDPLPRLERRPMLSVARHRRALGISIATSILAEVLSSLLDYEYDTGDISTATSATVRSLHISPSSAELADQSGLSRAAVFSGLARLKDKRLILPVGHAANGAVIYDLTPLVARVHQLEAASPQRPYDGPEPRLTIIYDVPA